MRVLEVIEAKHWRHTSGRTASIYGAVPYYTDAQRGEWAIETKGFTWRMSNGTVGLLRPAAKTRAEAEAVAAKINTKADNDDRQHREMYPESYA